ncbi:DNA polymerase III subunit delta' [Rhodoblastus sp. 17X3]|uniref:DNA polymerase III subunit delta' n=1 Tax=Rhodoblastus sp. 17X3 TaxID=3047026 RepID=UPI0024B854B0|nr:DNA polymerase III subunit delta' [Rhodoblastus sp. 17X3]MDI9847188.1 DNA polymerase III subunit delta' [Rhodoblastus sp. 17X3]
MGVKAGEDGLPESDRFSPAPHPRDTFQLFGHEHAESEFLEAFRAGRMPQAWIIGGPPGIGKATLAWRMARFMAAHPDSTAPAVQQARNLAVDPRHPVARKISALAYGDLALLRREWVEKNKKFATRITVDDVRRALHKFEQAAGEGGWRMALIDSADDLNVSSANALLKLIEEPPPRSLFLLVAHQPGRLLPTIRSRCRMLMLQRLETPALSEAVRAAADAAELRAPSDALGRACARADGSAHEALRLLAARDGVVDGLMEQVLAKLPQVNWRSAHRIADAVTGREGEVEFDAFLRSCFDWLAGALRRNPGLGPRALAPYAEVWEFLERETRDLEIYNLDKRAFAIIVFSRLAEAERAARAALA